MAKPIPSGIVSDMLVSAAQVVWNGNDLGFASGVAVNLKHEVTEVKTDQMGKSVVNDFYVGETMTVEMMLDEFTPEKLATAFPMANYIGTPGNSRITFGKQIGEDFFSLAKTLLIRPTTDDVAFLNRTLYFWKATPVGDAKIEFGPDKKIQIKLLFKIYPDLTQPAGLWFGYIGDPAAGTLVPSSAAAAVPGGGNVGNGTLTGPTGSGNATTNDDFTKSETWTLTCIHAVTNGGIFSVTGSVTGARGNATVGSVYHSNSIAPGNSEINLKINDGSTDFAVGDTFTVATTAANWT